LFLDYYGLREQPFGVTPDPRFLYFGSSHREALASLYYGVESGRGFLALIAKPGMGKTTLLFHLLGKLRNSSRTAFLFQTQCDSRQFLRSLVADLGVECRGDDLFHLQSQLNEVLVRETQAGRRFVLVVDEAQNLDDPVLETLRMLSNFETPRAKLMQIILAGQPQLASKLASDKLVQLRQRVSIVSRLNQLTAAETADYIDHRLRVAGYAGTPLFGSEAVERIASGSEGIPRNINNLCFHALTLGFARGAKRIDISIVDETLADLSLDSWDASAGIEERTIDDPATKRVASPISHVAHTSEAHAKRRELPATLWKARLRAALAPMGGKVLSHARAVVAIAGRRRRKQTSGLRRAVAGGVTVGAICAATWLAFTGVNATSQSTENVSTHVQARNASSPKSGVQPLSQSSAVIKRTHIARSGGGRAARVGISKMTSEALVPEVRTAYGNSLSRLERALKMSTQRSISEGTRGSRYEQEF
jgi:type II secretory pathway predicted ATPase ExeA